MKEQRQDYGMTYLTYGLTIIGMIIGCLIYLADQIFYDAEYFRHGLEDYSIGAVMNLPLGQLAIYILKRRSEQLLLFVLGMLLTSCGMITGMYSVVFGAFYGVVTCNLLVQYGVRGLCYGMTCFFPHYLLYMIAMYYFGKWFYEQKEGKYKYYTNVNYLQYFIKFIVIFSLIVLSLIWEIHFQKNILKFFYQYLVS